MTDVQNNQVPQNEDNENRVIIAVTGANSGMGFALCHRFLRQLSVPESPTDTQPLTLTLILACRSKSKALRAIQDLYREHDLGLAGRKLRGVRERKGWREGLKIIWEELDMDQVGGKGGVLDFTERIKNNYPYLTTLILNAGMGAFTGINWWKAVPDWIRGPIKAVSEPEYIMQAVGKRSADGERGGVWGVNVLAGYIMAKELHSHLLASPPSLPLSPRAIYVSSKRAASRYLPQPDPTSDPQLLASGESYDASKYMAELVINELDNEFNPPRSSRALVGSQSKGEPRKVRALISDPGVALTGLFDAYLPWFLRLCAWVVLYIARWLGSVIHTCTPNNGAVSMYYLATAPDAALEPVRPAYPLPNRRSSISSNGALNGNAHGKASASTTSISSLLSPSSTTSTYSFFQPQPAPGKYLSLSTRFGTAYVTMARVGDWDQFGEYAKDFAAECERVRLDWRKRLGLDGAHGDVAKEGEKKVSGEGVKEGDAGRP